MQDVIDELRGMASELSGLRKELKPLNSNQSTITLNAGGVGVWIATTACAVMLGLSILGAAIIVDQQRQISDMQHYLQAIYQQAPHLRPEDE